MNVFELFNIRDFFAKGDFATGATQFLVAAGIAVVALVVFRAIAGIALRYFGASSVRRAWYHLRRAVSFAFFMLCTFLLRPVYTVEGHIEVFIDRVHVLAAVVAVTWVAVKCLSVVEDLVVTQYRVDEADNLRARKIQTQFGFLKRVAVVLIIAVGVLAGLLTFDAVRQIGATFLAGAGVAGLIIGLAAQKTLGLMLSGLQVAITQPIRLDDVLIVEGEWGKVEEIALTYVVLRIWDQRRLVVPVNYFLEQPFQNWTRVTSELLGTVFLRVDYTCPLEPLRRELKRLCAAHEKWDGRVAIIQVTEAQERSIELRVLVSAGDAPLLWDLRCAVREGLVDFIRREFPSHLPYVRARLTDGPNAEERLSSET